MEKSKTVLSSKTINFNWISGLAIPAIWPFLPEDFRNQSYAVPALTAYFTLGNIVLRFVTNKPITFGSNECKDETKES